MKPLIKLNLGLTIVAALFSQTSFAQSQGAGNGGDAIICTNKPNRLLDQFESETVLGKKNILDTNASYAKSIEQIINAIKEKDINRGQVIEGYWDEIKNEINVSEQGSKWKTIRFTDERLTEVDDEMIISMPSDCRLQQMVLQIDPKQYENSAWAGKFPRYTIQKQLWESLNSDQKAITIMHEFWYRYFLTYNAKNSRNARALNALYFTGNDKITSLKDYLDILSKTEINPVIFGFKTPFGVLSSNQKYQTNQDGTLYFSELGSIPLAFGKKAYVSYLTTDQNGAILKYWLKNIHGKPPYEELCFGCTVKLYFENASLISKHGAYPVQFSSEGKLNAIFPGAVKIKLRNGITIKNPTSIVYP